MAKERAKEDQCMPTILTSHVYLGTFNKWDHIRLERRLLIEIGVNKQTGLADVGKPKSPILGDLAAGHPLPMQTRWKNTTTAYNKPVDSLWHPSSEMELSV